MHGGACSGPVTCRNGQWVDATTPAPQPIPSPSPAPTQSAPVINGLDAPTTLSVGQTGNWTVHASVPNQTNASLRYSVTWGDEGNSAAEQIAAFANGGATQVQVSGSFTHIYNRAGIFTPKFTVSNDAGSAQTSATVSVGLVTPNTPPPQPSPTPLPPTASGSCTMQTPAGSQSCPARYTTDIPATCKRWGVCPVSCERSYEGGPITCVDTWASCAQSTVLPCREYFSQTSGGSCVFSDGISYADGATVPFASDCSGVGGMCGWTTANLYICRQSSFRWERCSGGNMIGPSDYWSLTPCTGSPYVQRSASAATTSNLANALSALESALRSLLAKLGQ